MYGVVLCPRCHRAKGVRATQKTTACSCGFTIPVRASALRASVATVTELPEAVRSVALEVAGGALPPARPRRRSKVVHERVASAARSGDRRTRILAAAEGLTREVVLFTRDDLDRVLRSVRVPDVDAALDALRRENLIVEPRPGYFRTVT